MGGDRRVGPSPFSDRPAPPHSLHNLTRPDRGQPASCADLLLHCILPGLRLPCHALPAFALPPYLPMPLFALSFTLTMCSRTTSESVLQGLPCRQPHSRGMHLSSPDISLLLHEGQFNWPVRQRMACRVRVSCLQQLKFKKRISIQRQSWDL